MCVTLHSKYTPLMGFIFGQTAVAILQLRSHSVPKEGFLWFLHAHKCTLYLLWPKLLQSYEKKCQVHRAFLPLQNLVSVLVNLLQWLSASFLRNKGLKKFHDLLVWRLNEECCVVGRTTVQFSTTLVLNTALLYAVLHSNYTLQTCLKLSCCSCSALVSVS